MTNSKLVALAVSFLLASPASDLLRAEAAQVALGTEVQAPQHQTRSAQVSLIYLTWPSADRLR